MDPTSRTLLNEIVAPQGGPASAAAAPASEPFSIRQIVAPAAPGEPQDVIRVDHVAIPAAAPEAV